MRDRGRRVRMLVALMEMAVAESRGGGAAIKQ